MRRWLHDAMPLVPAFTAKAHIADIAPQHTISVACWHLALLPSPLRLLAKFFVDAQLVGDDRDIDLYH